MEIGARLTFAIWK